MPRDQRLDNAPFAAYLGAFGAMGVVQLALGPSLATLRAHTHATTATIGVLFTVGSAGYLAGVLLAGQVVARRDVHRVLQAGLVLVALGALLVPRPRALAVLAAVELLIGFGTGLIEIAANATVLWRRGSPAALNALHASFAVGATVVPIVVGRSIAWTDGIDAAWLVVALVAFLPAVALARRAGPPNPHLEVGRGVPRGTRALTALAAAWFGMYVGVEIGVAGWIYDYARHRGVHSTQTATLLGAVFLGAFAVGRIAGVPIARRMAPARLLAVDHVVALGAAVILLVGGDRRIAMFGGAALFALGLASMFPSMLSMSERFVPATGTVTSLYFVGAAAGTMVIPWLIGGLLETVGAKALPVVAITGVALAGVTALVFASRGAARPADLRSRR